MRIVAPKLPLMLIYACLLATLLAAGCGRPPGSVAEDLDGKRVDLLALGKDAITVFIFTSVDCPISNRLAPDIQKVIASFNTNDVKFWLVYPFEDLSAAEIRNHMRSYGYTSITGVRDPEHQLVNLAKARITPEAAVFNRDGKLLYRGRINDLYLELGKPRPAATENDLLNVLQAAVSGQPAPYSSKPAVGCYIPTRDK